MKFGIGIPNCREGIRHPAPFLSGPEDIVKVAQLAERLGLDSVWGSDFTNPSPKMHIPPDKQQPNWYEVLISLAYCAAVTERILLGVGVIVLPYREPVILAKQLATLDQFSKGRLLFGVGIGGWRDEFDSIRGKDRNVNRGKMLEEQLELLNLLLTQDDVNFEGQYFEVHNVSLNPRPVQKPLPNYISGNAPEIAARVAKWGTGQSIAIDADVPKKIGDLRKALQERGRDISEVDVLVHGRLSLARTHEEAVKHFLGSRIGASIKEDKREQAIASNFIGTPEEVAEKIGRLPKEGATHCVAQNISANSFGELLEQVHMFGEEVVPLVK